MRAQKPQDGDIKREPHKNYDWERAPFKCKSWERPLCVRGMLRWEWGTETLIPIGASLRWPGRPVTAGRSSELPDQAVPLSRPCLTSEASRDPRAGSSQHAGGWPPTPSPTPLHGSRPRLGWAWALGPWGPSASSAHHSAAADPSANFHHQSWQVGGRWTRLGGVMEEQGQLG